MDRDGSTSLGGAKEIMLSANFASSAAVVRDRDKSRIPPRSLPRRPALHNLLTSFLLIPSLETTALQLSRFVRTSASLSTSSMEIGIATPRRAPRGTRRFEWIIRRVLWKLNCRRLAVCTTPMQAASRGSPRNSSLAAITPVVMACSRSAALRALWHEVLDGSASQRSSSHMMRSCRAWSSAALLPQFDLALCESCGANPAAT